MVASLTTLPGERLTCSGEAVVRMIAVYMSANCSHNTVNGKSLYVSSFSLSPFSTPSCSLFPASSLIPSFFPPIPPPVFFVLPQLPSPTIFLYVPLPSVFLFMTILLLPFSFTNPSLCFLFVPLPSALPSPPPPLHKPSSFILPLLSPPPPQCQCISTIPEA